MQQSSTHNDSALRPAALVSVGVMVMLLIASLVFYRERMLFIDAPHIFFRIVNDGVFQINDFRWGSYITQAVPYFGAKLHIPLKPLLMAYSASFNVFFLGVSCVLVFLYRNYRLAILGGLYYTLFASATFYWPNNEVHQGISWMLLAFGTMQYMADKSAPFILTALVSAAMLYLAMWTHPLVVPATLFIWCYSWVLERKMNRWQLGSLSAVLIVLAALKFNQGMHHGYDSVKIETVTGFNPRRLLKFYEAPQWKWFAHECLHRYWLVLLLTAAGISALLYQPRYTQVVITIGAIKLYLILVIITYWDITGTRFYMESEYMPLGLIAATPFVMHLLPILKPRSTVALLACIHVTRLAYILFAAAPFQQRVQVTENVLQHMRLHHLTKAVILAPSPVDDVMIMNWGAPVESITLSALDGEKPQRTFLFASADELKQPNTAADTFSGCWELRPAKRFNAHYFSFDTLQRYTIIPYDSLVRVDNLTLQ